jgi:hypothetical protein
MRKTKQKIPTVLGFFVELRKKYFFTKLIACRINEESAG